ncbi:uncharacterized protein ACLA_050260 [Aspergillus clavatus NRRL 1]|uniref:Zn(2)-C6 fungal-type domain-containing protein n=1 Tax=Aspergillus clavatus (strain ATCC 1007 / CBS 513.65 / DSM 816 / NCTC 3887 / NRRL 1 / QM 1276 / 107) TaxID=344612 RepID=A1CI49_ASPCL|nr:uncharacterized protein ACLA_050260 [Aspergillus clavatus NRRL 1]EAW10554.1 conserved hypothetical protein [Aspergillus clavatus NRRL 1]
MGSTYPLSTGPIDGPVEHSHPFTNSTTDSITCSMNNLHHFEAYPHAQSTQSQVPIEISFPRQGSVPNTRLEYQPGPRSRISPDICTEIPFERQNNSSNGLFSAIAQNAPCSPVEYLHSSNHTSPFTKDGHEGLASANSQELNIVLEDPRILSQHRKRRLRSKREFDQAKQDNQLIRTLGGACIWCYRKKKRCGTVVACLTCQKLGLQCIRKYTQLSFVQDSPKYANRLPDQMGEMFSCLKDHASKNASERIAVSFRSRTIDLWTANAAMLNLANVNTLNEVNRQLHLQSMGSVHCDQLNKLEDFFPGVSLVETALSMYKLASVIICLCKTQVHVPAADVDRARSIVLYMLNVHLQRLYELSDELCSVVFGMMRRKEPHIGHAEMENDHASLESLGPVWVAVALYYRVVDSLASFEAGPLLAALLMDAKEGSESVSASVLCVLKHIFLNSKSDMNNMTNELLEQHIPTIQTRHFDIAVEVYRGSQMELLTATPREASPFSDESCSVESLFEKILDDCTPSSDARPEAQANSAPQATGQNWLNDLEAELAETMPFDDGLFTAEDSEEWQMTLAEGCKVPSTL